MQRRMQITAAELCSVVNLSPAASDQIVQVSLFNIYLHLIL